MLVACTLERLLAIRLRERIFVVWLRKLIASNFAAVVIVTIGTTAGAAGEHQGVAL